MDTNRSMLSANRLAGDFKRRIGALDPDAKRFSEVVAVYAVAIGDRLGLVGADLLRLRFAAELQCVGPMLGEELPEEIFPGVSSLIVRDGSDLQGEAIFEAAQAYVTDRYRTGNWSTDAEWRESVQSAFPEDIVEAVLAVSPLIQPVGT